MHAELIFVVRCLENGTILQVPGQTRSPARGHGQLQALVLNYLTISSLLIVTAKECIQCGFNLAVFNFA